MASTIILVLALSASTTLGLQLVGSAQALGTYGAQVWIQSPTSNVATNSTIPLLVTAQIIYRSNSSADDQITSLLQNTTCQFSVDGGTWQNLTFVQLAGAQAFTDPIYNNWIHEDNCTYSGAITGLAVNYHSLNVTIQSPDSQGSSQMYFTVGNASSTSAYQSLGTWKQETPMLQARFNAGVAALNGIVYVMGGGRTQVNGNEFSTVTTSEVEAGIPGEFWMPKTHMPVAMQSFGAAAYQGMIYAIGGSANYMYNPETDTWTIKTPMPTPRTDLQASVVGGKIYLIGGVEKESVSNVNEAYDPAAGAWSTCAPIPSGVFDYASVVANGKIYVISGYAGNLNVATAATNLTQVYDPATNTWSQAAPIPTTAASSAAAVLTGNDGSTDLYVIDGSRASNPLDAQAITQVYFPANNTWSQAAAMMVDRAGLAATVVGNTLYTFGGGHNIFTPDTADVWQFTPTDTTAVNATNRPLTSANPSPTQSQSPASSAMPTATLTATISTQPTNSSAGSPSPSIPELSSWIILSLLAAVGVIISFRMRPKR